LKYISLKNRNKKSELSVDPNNNHIEKKLHSVKEQTATHMYWAFAGIVSIFAVCAARFFIKVETPSPFINNLPIALITICAIFTLTIVGTVRSYPFVKSIRYKILLMASLAIVFAVGLSSSPIGLKSKISIHNGYRLYPDSSGYCKSYWKGNYRPPVYYTLISLAIGREPTDLFKKPPRSNPKPFLKIVRAQRYLLAFGWLFCCFAMMSFLSPPIVAALFLGFFSVNNTIAVAPDPVGLGYAFPIFIGFVLFLILLYEKQVEWKGAVLFSFFVIPLACVLVFLGSHVGFVSEQINAILSDCLAQALLMVVAGLAITFYYRGWRLLLPLTALFCGLMYQTRPAAIYVFVIIGLMAVSALVRNRKNYLPAVVASVLVLIIMVWGPSMCRRRHNSTPAHLGWSKIMFALQIAEVKDIQYIKTEEGKKFFKLAMERKKKADKEFKSRLDHEWNWQFLPRNLYKVANPVIRENKMDKLGIINDVCNPILFHRFDRYLNIVLETYIYCMEVSRLNALIPVWIIFFISLVLILYLRDAGALAAGTLITAHAVHYLVISMFTNPCRRFLDASEMLVIIAMFILVVDATYEIWKSKPDSLVRKKPSILSMSFINWGLFKKKSTLITILLLSIFSLCFFISLTSHAKKVRLEEDVKRISKLRALVRAVKLYHKKHRYVPTSGTSEYINLMGSWNDVLIRACEPMVKDGFLKEVPRKDERFSYFYFPENFFYFPGNAGGRKPQAAIISVILTSKPEVIKNHLLNEWKDIYSILLSRANPHYGLSFHTDLSKGKVSVIVDLRQTEESEVERISNMRIFINAVKLYYKKYGYVPTSGTSEYVSLRGSWNDIFTRACDTMVRDGFLKGTPQKDKEFGFSYLPVGVGGRRPQTAILGVTLASSPKTIEERLEYEWEDIKQILFTKKNSPYPFFTTNFSEGKIFVTIEPGQTEESDMDRISNMRMFINAIKLYYKKHQYVPTSGTSEYISLKGSWNDIFMRACGAMVKDGFLKEIPQKNKEFGFSYLPVGGGGKRPQTAILGVKLASEPELIKALLQEGEWEDINPILLTKEHAYNVAPFYTDLSKSKIYVILDLGQTNE